MGPKYTDMYALFEGDAEARRYFEDLPDYVREQIKTRAGKLPGGENLLSVWDETLSRIRADGIDITAADAIMAGGLPWPYRDPFDRMLVAQAARRGLTLASSDAVVLAGATSPTLDTRR